MIINEATENILKIRLNDKDYRIVNFPYGLPRKKTEQFIHRLVALLFVDKPERHKDIPFSDLQVNHKNGNKAENHKNNLEWVTCLENIEHARENGLYNDEKKVLAKCVETGEVIEFASISKCAEWLCIRVGTLHLHLYSANAGIVEKNGYRFKFDDGNDWPEIIPYDKHMTGINRLTTVIAENVETGKKFLSHSIKDAVIHIGLKTANVMKHRKNHGYEEPYYGWVFHQLRSWKYKVKGKGKPIGQ